MQKHPQVLPVTFFCEHLSLDLTDGHHANRFVWWVLEHGVVELTIVNLLNWNLFP